MHTYKHIQLSLLSFTFEVSVSALALVVEKGGLGQSTAKGHVRVGVSGWCRKTHEQQGVKWVTVLSELEFVVVHHGVGPDTTSAVVDHVVALSALHKSLVVFFKLEWVLLHFAFFIYL